MKTFAAALLVALSGKEVTEDAIKKVLDAAGAKQNADEIKKLAEAMKGKKVEDLIKQGEGKICAGGAPAAESHEEKKEDHKRPITIP